MPFPSKKRPARRCWQCGTAELSEVKTIYGPRKFLLVPNRDGHGPECPPQSGCTDRQRQTSFKFR